MLNSIITLKPTYDLVSNKGVVPVALSLDTVGALTQSADDLKIITGILTGSKYSFKDSKKLKVGIINLSKEKNNPIFEKFKCVLEKSMSIIPSDNFSLEDIKYLEDEVDATMVAEFPSSLNSYFRDTENTKVTVKYLVDQKKGGPANSYDRLKKALSSTSCNNTHDIQKGQTLARKAIDALLEKNKVDALLVFEDPNLNGIIYSAMARYPSMTIPLGLDDKGFPKSIFACTRANSDAVLLSVALAADRNPRFRHKPMFIGY
ncbi:hypothetical protein DSO57_1025614 [Entomophthora muscae]|uniref:Uncharacterized protein n=1 Tax=Entomophthora muscae TaxID=34485 RepID=A0ACC2TEF3_9FUNG|nr:hypothetical protein DSO57_1025614 [Entomophthora muscae]